MDRTRGFAGRSSLSSRRASCIRVSTGIGSPWRFVGGIWDFFPHCTTPEILLRHAAFPGGVV
jgi:hypothetical protein